MTKGHVRKFGFWKANDDECFLLSWDPNTGWLDLDDDHIARIRSEDRVLNVLAGYEDHIGQPNSMRWLTARIDAAR